MSNIKRSRTTRSKSKNQQIDEADKWPLKASSYKLEQPISKGQYGLCWKAHCHDTSSPHHQRQVSIKIISIAQFPHEGIEELDNEIKISSQCNHKNIMKYYVSFVNDNELWLIMPFVSRGTLRTNLRQQFPNGIKDEVLIASILHQILEAISYFHAKGYMHRDIKADNILVHESGQLFLGNFFQSSNNSTENEFIGSPPWMAPEVMAQKEAYSNKSDMWSLGITILELIQGKAPNEHQNSIKLVQTVINDPAPEVNKYETKWSKEFRALVASILKKEAKSREAANVVLKKYESFFKQQKGEDYVKQSLFKDKSPAIEPEVIAAGNHYFNLKYQRQARSNSVSFGNKKLDSGNKKKKILWNFNTTLEDQQIAASQMDVENESENIEQTESLCEESINDESRVHHLDDQSITSQSTRKKKQIGNIGQPMPSIVLDESVRSEQKSINNSKRSNVIMETIDILNDKKHVSESFDQPASSKRSNFEEMDQFKILQTEDERQNMSMRRNNFETYNQASVVQQQYVETNGKQIETNDKNNESQDQVFTLGRSDSPDHTYKKTDFTSNINLQQSSPLQKPYEKAPEIDVPLNIKSNSSSRMNHSLLEPERALLQELQTPQQKSDEQKNGIKDYLIATHQEGKLNQSHQQINQSHHSDYQGAIHKKNMSSYKHTESQYHNQSFVSNRNIIEEQQSKCGEDDDEPHQLDSDEELNDE